LIVLGLVSVLSVFAVVAYIYVAGQGDGGLISFAIFGALPISIVYFAWMLLRIWKPVSPARGDTYPSQSDPFRQRQRGLRVLFVAATITGLALSFVLLAGAGTIGLDFLWIRVAISLLAQFLFVVVPGLAFRVVCSLDLSGYRTA
jgi:hypothetical protein